jgi:hypothetical protein
MNGIHKCFETSALTGQNVEDVFSLVGKEMYQSSLLEENDKKDEKPKAVLT